MTSFRQKSSTFSYLSSLLNKLKLKLELELKMELESELLLLLVSGSIRAGTYKMSADHR